MRVVPTGKSGSRERLLWLTVLALGCGETSSVSDAYTIAEPDSTGQQPVFTIDTNTAVSFDTGPTATDLSEPDIAPPDDAASGFEDVPAAPPDLGPPPDLGCVPSCEGKLCGNDGCGGTCGTPCADTEICSNFQCIPDPTLGCEGLALAENWTGEFEGDMEFSALGLIPIPASTSGEMAFQIKCFNSKLVVSGSMSGEASDNKFSLELSGTYSPTNKTVKAKLLKGDVTVFAVIQYLFEGELEGTLGADGTFTGTWSMGSTEAKLLGTVNPAVPPLTGDGTWTAKPGP